MTPPDRTPAVRTHRSAVLGALLGPIPLVLLLAVTSTAAGAIPVKDPEPDGRRPASVHAGGHPFGPGCTSVALAPGQEWLPARRS